MFKISVIAGNRYISRSALPFSYEGEIYIYFTDAF